MGLLRRSTLAPLDEAAAYARCHGTRSTEVRIVKLPPRRRRAAASVTEGSAPETPFAAISMVGLVITVAAVFFLALTIAARVVAT